MKKRILILGGSGFLGSSLEKYLSDKFKIFIGVRCKSKTDLKPNRYELSYSTKKKLFSQINSINPDLIVNCIAIANVDYCETNFQEAKQVMVDDFINLVAVSKSLEVPFIHISTDQLYSSEIRKFYLEDDLPEPINNYGKLKLQSEKIILDRYDKSIVLRTNFFGTNYPNNTSQSDAILDSVAKNQIYRGFNDVVCTPIHTSVLAKVISLFENMNLNNRYNVSSDEAITKFVFGQMLCKTFGYEPKLVIPISVNDLKLTAPRSKNMALKNDKIKLVVPQLDYSIKSSLIQYRIEKQNSLYKE